MEVESGGAIGVTTRNSSTGALVVIRNVLSLEKSTQTFAASGAPSRPPRGRQIEGGGVACSFGSRDDVAMTEIWSQPSPLNAEADLQCREPHQRAIDTLDARLADDAGNFCKFKIR